MTTALPWPAPQPTPARGARIVVKNGKREWVGVRVRARPPPARAKRDDQASVKVVEIDRSVGVFDQPNRFNVQGPGADERLRTSSAERRPPERDARGSLCLDLDCLNARDRVRRKLKWLASRVFRIRRSSSGSVHVTTPSSSAVQLSPDESGFEFLKPVAVRDASRIVRIDRWHFLIRLDES